ncbi:MAG: hypothetical protein AB7O59_24820 [Pirellulales bacterium]
MHSLAIAGVVFIATFGGAMLGMLLQRLIPESHLLNESKEVIRIGSGLIATMAALVLGLLVGGAKSSFDAHESGFRQLAVDLQVLDRTLAQYGPAANPAREQLQQLMAVVIDGLWPEDPSQSVRISDARITDIGTKMYDVVRALSPTDESQTQLKGQAVQLYAQLARDRWSLSHQTDNSLPLPFLTVLAFWFFVLFISFGLLGPRNMTAVLVLLICGLSVAGAVFLIVDLSQPLDGLLRVSSNSMRNALVSMGQ